jgi:hypothetical protein
MGFAQYVCLPAPSHSTPIPPGGVPVLLRAHLHAFASTAIGLYPYLLLSEPHPERSLTIANAAAAPAGLLAAALWMIPGVILLAIYQGFVYRTFKGKVVLGTGAHYLVPRLGESREAYVSADAGRSEPTSSRSSGPFEIALLPSRRTRANAESPSGLSCTSERSAQPLRCGIVQGPQLARESWRQRLGE